MTMNIGILIFDGAEELDFVGPWEVFTMTEKVRPGSVKPVLIASGPGPVTCAKGMRVLPDHGYEDHPALDVVLVPGGQGTRRLITDTGVRDWLRRVAPGCSWVTSVCTGSLVLTAAGMTRGRRTTTHWVAMDELKALAATHGGGEVVSGPRYVVDGTLVTSTGVSAGTDMALWLVGQWFGVETARLTRHWMQYDPEPPYSDADAA